MLLISSHLFIYATFSNIVNQNATFYHIYNLHYSQTTIGEVSLSLRLIAIWIYTTLKLMALVASMVVGLITIWIYTTLKPRSNRNSSHPSLITIWNYTTLKLLIAFMCNLRSLITIWNYTTLKPQISSHATTSQVVFSYGISV